MNTILIIILVILIIIGVVCFCNKKENFTIYNNCPPGWLYNFEDPYPQGIKKWITPTYLDMIGKDGKVDKEMNWEASTVRMWPYFRKQPEGPGGAILYKYSNNIWK